MLPHAPGVQMQAIPEDDRHEDSGDEEEDPNKRISSKHTSHCYKMGSLAAEVGVLFQPLSVDCQFALKTKG